MKTHLTALIGLAAALSLASCAGEKKELSWAEKLGYELAWEDDFEGDSINAAVWNLEDNSRGGGNAEMQYYAPKNVTIEKSPGSGEGCMVLNALREDYRGRPATSGRVNTRGKFSVQYGVVEARIKLPRTADGLWPAFWMLGADLIPDMGNDDSFEAAVRSDSTSRYVVWPKCGEIDILEMGHADGIKNGLQDRYFNGACHWGEAVVDGRYPNYVHNYTAEASLQDDFHLFSLVWTPDSIQMYLDRDKNPDAEPYYQLATVGRGTPDMPGTYFNKPFYIVFNLAVGGYFTGLPAPEKYPAEISPEWENFRKIEQAGVLPGKMYIDYVRVYRK